MISKYHVELVGEVFHLVKEHEGTDEIIGVYETNRQAQDAMSRLRDEESYGK